MLRLGVSGTQHERRPRRDHPPGTGPGRVRPQTRQAGPGAHRWGRRDEGDHRAPHPPPGVLQRRGSPCPTTHRRPTGTIPQTAWSPAYNADGHPGNGAHAAETRRPAGPNRLAPGHAGQPRATSSPTRVAGRASRTSRGLPAHRPRHQYKRRPAPRPRSPPPATNPPPGNRIRRTKDTRLDHVPSQNLAQNRIWRPIMAPARRPADLLPDAGPGRRLCPRLGAQDDPPATDEHPRHHHPPQPPPPPAAPSPTTRPTAPGTPYRLTTSGTSRPHRPHRQHDPCTLPTTILKEEPRPPKSPDHRSPTRDKPTHPPTTPTTPPNPTQPTNKKPRPDARFPSSLKKKRKRPSSSSSSRIGGSSSHDEHVPSRREENRLRYGNRITESPAIGKTFLRSDARPGSAHIRIRDTMNRADRYIY